MNIPKIIHQTAPKEESRWHPIWKECQQSWKDNFFDFEYVLWDDEDIRNLIKNDYPQYLREYDSWPYHIMRVDFFRLCVLHKYGGIYADMDIFCYKNFYNLLDQKEVYIIESWPEWKENIQNSLMASSPNHNFWINFADKGIEKLYELSSQKMLSDKLHCIFNTFGPQHLSKFITSNIGILPKELFNPIIDLQFSWVRDRYKSIEYKQTLDYYKETNKNNKDVITRHYLTSCW